MTRAVFLDRDGVLNRITVDTHGVPHPPVSVADLELEEGAAAACLRLRSAGWHLLVVTNQPDVARGTARRSDVEAINQRLRDLLPVDDVLVCWHDDGDGCNCRKPQPGLLVEAATRWKIDLAASVMVGDRGSDVEAGRRAGCRTILLRRPHSGAAHPDTTVSTLTEAADWILTRATTTPETHEPALA